MSLLPGCGLLASYMFRSNGCITCIILLFVFQNRIKRMIPIFYIAEMFEEIVKEKSGKQG